MITGAKLNREYIRDEAWRQANAARVFVAIVVLATMAVSLIAGFERLIGVL